MSSMSTPAKIKPPRQPLKVPAEAGIAVVFYWLCWAALSPRLIF